MMTNKSQNYECCMCGDHGLSHELFRCKVCHFRSQHRYCSNLYPKAATYRACNWCLIQNNDTNHTDTTTTTTTTTTTISNNNNSWNSSSPAQKHSTRSNNIVINKIYNHLGWQKAGPGTKGLQPMSPIKKPTIRSMEAQSPTGRKRITAVHCATKDDRLCRTKSSIKMINNNDNSNNNNNNKSSSTRSSGQGVIKHVFRNKVRRYKLLDEVST
ncbi:hypothetical protein vseg_009529 [Gypsophila vaccaria]